MVLYGDMVLVGIHHLEFLPERPDIVAVPLGAGDFRDELFQKAYPRMVLRPLHAFRGTHRRQEFRLGRDDGRDVLGIGAVVQPRVVASPEMVVRVLFGGPRPVREEMPELPRIGAGIALYASRLPCREDRLLARAWKRNASFFDGAYGAFRYLVENDKPVVVGAGRVVREDVSRGAECQRSGVGVVGRVPHEGELRQEDRAGGDGQRPPRAEPGI